MTQEQKAILYDWQNEYRTDGETVDALIQTLDERHDTLVKVLLDPKTNHDDTDEYYISDHRACELMEEAIKAEMVV
jgi:hypothetical protein